MLGTSLSSWPSYSEEEAALVSQVLLSNRVNYWTGRICRDFEADYAAHCRTQLLRHHRPRVGREETVCQLQSLVLKALQKLV
ncbi:MAG: hypothetical protein RL095_1030 [Verrucomicrobiota bacterium]|jgi:hypothetical protein